MSTLHIHIPEWSNTVTETGVIKPFAFWNVGDQPMLYHWLDMAQESDYESVIIHSESADHLESCFFDKKHFWPVSCEFTSAPCPQENSGPDFDVVSIETLTVNSSALTSFTKWGLIDHHWKLTTDRLEVLSARYMGLAPGIAVGRGSRVHPDAKLTGPYWIGENCDIGEGVVIGPYACLGDNCVIEPGAQISTSYLGNDTIVGVDVKLQDHFVEEGKVFNRKKRIHHQVIDPLIVSTARGGPSSPHDVVLTR